MRRVRSGCGDESGGAASSTGHPRTGFGAKVDRGATGRFVTLTKASRQNKLSVTGVAGSVSDFLT